MNLAGLVLVSAVLSACAGRSANHDADPCGFAGCVRPPVETRLHIVRGGLEWDNQRGVQLDADVGLSSDLQGASAILTWDGSRMSPRPEALHDDPKLKYGPGGSLVWTDPDLTMTLASVVGTHTGTLTVVDQGKTTVLHCTTEGPLVRCDP